MTSASRGITAGPSAHRSRRVSAVCVVCSYASSCNRVAEETLARYAVSLPLRKCRLWGFLKLLYPRFSDLYLVGTQHFQIA